MPKFTKRHYIATGNLLKKVPKNQRKVQERLWEKQFEKDNPRFNKRKFRSFVGVK